MPGNLYDAYNPFAGTERNLDRFVNLYERKKQRGLQERELGLRERGLGIQQQQENRLGQSQGIEDEYKQMLISKETSELQMKQDLMNDPGTRITIMSKALKQAFKMTGKKGVDNVLKTFQANPKYQEDTKGYTADDIQFTEDGLMVMPIKDKTTGKEVPGYYGFTGEDDKPHIIDTNKFNKESKPSSVQEYEYSQNLPEDQKAQFEKFAAPVSVPILADRAARGDKIAQAALAQVNVSQLINTDQGIKNVNKRTNVVQDTGLTNKPELSDTAIKEIGSLNTLQQSVNDLSLLSEKVSMGPAAGRLEQAKANWFNNLSSDNQLEFNTINQQLFNVIGELRGGKVLTENEMNRLLAELPSQNLPYKTYKARLKVLNRYLDRTITNKMKTYEQANYNVKNINQSKPSLDDIFKGQ